MSDPAWPFECPRSWAEKPKTSVLRSEVDAGPPKSRARFTKSYREIQAGWVFDSWSKMATVQTFIQQDLSDGSRTFTMTHPITGATLRLRFKDSPTYSSDVSKKPSFEMSADLEEVLA